MLRFGATWTKEASEVKQALTFFAHNDEMKDFYSDDAGEIEKAVKKCRWKTQRKINQKLKKNIVDRECK